MSFIDTHELSQALAGSYEHQSAQVDDAMPPGTVAIATFPDRVVYERDGGIFNRSWTKGDDGIEFGDEASAGIKSHDESNLNFVLGRSILSAVDAIWEGAPVNLSGLVPLVDPDDIYFGTDYIALGESAMGDREWSLYYEGNRADVRKACHGKLGVTEGKVPSRRFSRLRGDCQEYRAQMIEVVDTICSLATEVADTIDSADSSEEGFGSSLIDDAQRLKEALTGLKETCGTVHMKDFATILDRSCDRMRDLLVMAEYISIDD